MKRNSKRLILALLALALCFVFAGRPSKAATKNIAFINSTDKALVYKCKEFCASGYSVSVKNLDTGSYVIKNQAVAGGTVGADKMFKVYLNNYKTKTRYQLTITANDKKNTVTARYYSGSALKKSSVKRTSKDALKCTITLSSGFSGSGEFRVYAGDNSTEMVASAKFKKTKSTSAAASIPASSLGNANYKVYAIMSYKKGGKTYYGQGRSSTYKYIKSQGTISGLYGTTTGGMVTLAWNPDASASYYRVYQSTSKSGSYKCIADGLKTTRYTTKSLKGGKNYYYKVQSVGVAGTTIVGGAMSSVVAVKVPVVPGKVSGLTLYLDINNKLCVKWSESTNTTGYYVYYKTATGTYKSLGKTTNRYMSLSKLKSNTQYSVVVRAYRKKGSTVTKADFTSDALTFVPSSYIASNRTALLANGVRTIKYIGKTKSVYTTRHYTTERKLAFVNLKGYSSSTNYLIWISHYTQQVMIYKGSKGNWKLIRSCDAATGKAATPSPRGVYKVTYKETGWYYVSTKELYVTHWCGRNSFHTRPLYNDGSLCTATIGKPASHGCARLYNSDAKYIYDNIPKGTTVVSY